MGLLDGITGSSWDDPRTAATFALAQGLLGNRNVAQGLLSGMQGYGGTLAAAREAERKKMLEDEQRKAIAEERGLRMEQLRGAMAEQQQQRQQAATDQGLLRTQFGPQAGPTQDGLPIQPGAFDPRMMLGQGGSLQGALQGLNLQQALTPQRAKPTILKPGDVAFDDNGTQLFSAPDKPEKAPEALRTLEMIFGKDSPQYAQASIELARKMTSHPEGAKVTVNTDNLGLKPKDRFEMEQKLANDYQGQTKLDRGIISTAQDISGLLKQPGSLKDQAAIYKFAKALDPDGAVREADYAAIVKTAGGLDYVRGLFNKALTGEQMLPKQRDDMLRVVTGMANVAATRVATEKKRFGENATMYNLKPENVFGREDTVINFSDLK